MRLRLPLTFAGLAVSTALGLLGITVSSHPASAVIYCQYVGYPVGCVARGGCCASTPPGCSRCGSRGGPAGDADESWRPCQSCRPSLTDLRSRGLA